MDWVESVRMAWWLPPTANTARTTDLKEMQRDMNKSSQIIPISVIAAYDLLTARAFGLQ